jgi:leader peptidase (prepilin peptidase) / N-methyltransferase
MPIRLYATILAALLGLAFGSFLNVCLTRWPAGESILRPRSHCRACGRTLAWWENIPLVSWLALRGRCRTCRAWIGWRYALVEAAVGVLWGFETWRSIHPELLSTPTLPSDSFWFYLAHGVGQMFFLWLLIALSVLDAEHFWLPDRLTWLGIGTGILTRTILLVPFLHINDVSWRELPEFDPLSGYWPFLAPAIAAGLAALLILLIRWTYKFFRHREGIGLGDAKLMAMLAAWLGLPGALLSFFIGIVLGALTGLVLLAWSRKEVAAPNSSEESAGTSSSATQAWALRKLPLGTFLCIGGIVSAFWGQPILAAYLRWAGF